MTKEEKKKALLDRIFEGKQAKKEEKKEPKYVESEEDMMEDDDDDDEPTMPHAKVDQKDRKHGFFGKGISIIIAMKGKK